jgi:hypothetical protein
VDKEPNKLDRSLPRRVFTRLPPILPATLLAMSLLGCNARSASTTSDGTTAADNSQAALPEISAAAYLKQVLARYQSTRSYSDAGEVRLRVEKEGRLTRQVAPMCVMLDQSTLWLAAYDARLWSDAEKTVGWIADEQTRFHDSQVVLGGSSATPQSSGRPVLEKLLLDPILTSRMVSGLGGPPPQLEWLLDPDPMAKLFPPRGDAVDGAPAIEYEGLAERDKRPCVVIRARVGKDLYRFWIDREQSLIRCVELPVSMAGRQVALDGWKVHSLELVLSDASFMPPKAAYELSQMPKAVLPARPRYLRSLVPIPPPRPDPRLGQTVGAFKRTDLAGQSVITHRGVDRALTLWYLGLPPSESQTVLQSIRTLADWLRQSPAPIRGPIRPVAVVDQDSARLLVDAGLGQTDWLLLLDRDQSLQEQLGIEPGNVALVDSQSRILWIGSASAPADVAALGAVIGDAIAGVNVPEQTLRQSESDHAAYRQKLEELAVE